MYQFNRLQFMEALEAAIVAAEQPSLSSNPSGIWLSCDAEQSDMLVIGGNGSIYNISGLSYVQTSQNLSLIAKLELEDVEVLYASLFVADGETIQFGVSGSANLLNFLECHIAVGNPDYEIADVIFDDDNQAVEEFAWLKGQMTLVNPACRHGLESIETDKELLNAAITLPSMFDPDNHILSFYINDGTVRDDATSLVGDETPSQIEQVVALIKTSPIRVSVSKNDLRSAIQFVHEDRITIWVPKKRNEDGLTEGYVMLTPTSNYAFFSLIETQEDMLAKLLR